ncbi:MAG: EAL domain-containing protein [Alphaproteobacteria bacterium]
MGQTTLQGEYNHAQHELKCKTIDARPSTSHDDIQNIDHLRALVTDAFKNGAIQEPIYGEDKILAYESLARPKDKTKEYSIGALSQAYYDIGRAVEFDVLTCSIGLDYAKENKKLPVTLNTSVESVLSPVFWKKMEKHFKDNGISPGQVIFEILEHDVDINTDISHLRDLKEQGYRFALDDFSIGQDHENRLIVFCDLVDFIKIDGPLVRAGLGETGEETHNFTEEQFLETINTLQERAPHAQLIAERTRSPYEAIILFEMGIDGVQGLKLEAEDFYYTPEARELENTSRIELS